MVSIHCKSISKKYVKEVLFKDFEYTFTGTNKYAILGANSSGKSTLLKILGSLISPTNGSVEYNSSANHPENISFCSPEMHLLDDYTVLELFEFHFQFKKAKMDLDSQYNNAQLHPFLNKKYSELSSGLKNKIKLTLALFADTPILLLDEPCTNFDQTNTQWYNATIEQYCKDQMIIVASNQEVEHQFCSEKINLHHYKHP